MSTAQQSPMQQNRRLRVFLCHASEDKQFVRALHRRLREEGFAPWLDERDLLPGQEWRAEIPAAVRASDVVIICLSHKSVSKEGFLQREIREALEAAKEKPEGTIFIIPGRIEEVEIPARLREWQWANLFSDDGYQLLVAALDRRADDLGISRGHASQPISENAIKEGHVAALTLPDDIVKLLSQDSSRYKKYKRWFYVVAGVILSLAGAAIVFATRYRLEHAQIQVSRNTQSQLERQLEQERQSSEGLARRLGQYEPPVETGPIFSPDHDDLTVKIRPFTKQVSVEVVLPGSAGKTYDVRLQTKAGEMIWSYKGVKTSSDILRLDVPGNLIRTGDYCVLVSSRPEPYCFHTDHLGFFGGLYR